MGISDGHEGTKMAASDELPGTGRVRCTSNATTLAYLGAQATREVPEDLWVLFEVRAKNFLVLAKEFVLLCGDPLPEAVWIFLSGCVEQNARQTHVPRCREEWALKRYAAMAALGAAGKPKNFRDAG